MAVLVFGVVLTIVVMMLWNWLMPNLFGLSMITFWQALGILALSKILFGGWMHNKKCHDCHHHKGGDWKEMNLGEKQSMKEKFMEKWSQCRFEESKSPEKEGDFTDSN